MRLIASFILCLLLPQTVAALPSGGIRCVQAQLNASGFDSGPEDGVLGPLTHAAFSRFEAEKGEITTRDLDPGLADAACRKLGLDNPELREYWDTKSGLTKVISGDSISPEFQTALQLSLTKTEQAIGDVLQQDLAGQDLVIVSENPAELNSLYQQYAPQKIRNFKDRNSKLCASKQNFQGRSDPGIMVICKAPDAAIGSGISQAWLDFVIAQGSMDLARFQLSGAIDKTKSGVPASERLSFEGPIWLSLGVAQAFGSSVARGTPDWKFRSVKYKQLENTFPNLEDLEQNKALRANAATVYRAGAVAAVDLVDIAGYPAIMKFYEQMGLGTTWKFAFQDAFGMTVEDFYAFYQTVPRFDDQGAALEGPLQR